MYKIRMIALAVVVLTGSSTWAADPVPVADFPATVEKNIQGDKVKMRLTGTAVRKKFIFSVYDIASYVQTGVKVYSAEGLASVNCYKQLHLVMLRDVDGETMASAFESSIRANYPAPAFNQEIKLLVNYMRSISVSEGDEVLLSHIPGVGFHCNLVGKTQFMIKNKSFSKAVWDIYFGKNNLGDAIKNGLTSRL